MICVWGSKFTSLNQMVREEGVWHVLKLKHQHTHTSVRKAHQSRQRDGLKVELSLQGMWGTGHSVCQSGKHKFLWASREINGTTVSLKICGVSLLTSGIFGILTLIPPHSKTFPETRRTGGKQQMSIENIHSLDKSHTLSSVSTWRPNVKTRHRAEDHYVHNLKRDTAFSDIWKEPMSHVDSPKDLWSVISQIQRRIKSLECLWVYLMQ